MFPQKVARDRAESERRESLPYADFENLFAVVGCVERRGGEAVMNINDTIIGQGHGGPAAVANGRKTAFADRARFFKNRRLTVVEQECSFPIGNLFPGSACTGKDRRSRLPNHLLLIRVLADMGGSRATGQ
jgi:hypothetical protein